MGYYSYCKSNVRFDPQISESLVEEIKRDLPDLTYHAEPNTEGLGDPYDSVKAYHLEEEARKLLEYLAREGSTATGTITVTGEENYDIWRLVFADGGVTKEKVKITWPDGSEYTG